MNRSVYLFLSVAFLSIGLVLLSCFSFINKQTQWKNVGHTIKELAFLAEQADLKERFFQKIIKPQTKSSPDFFQQELAKCNFGKKENLRLQKIIKNPAFFGNALLESRTQILENFSPKLNKKKVYSSKSYHELELSLDKPIYLEEEELIELLRLLECSHPNKPFSEILFFSCKREKIEGLNEMFKVDFTILTKDWATITPI